MGSFQKYLTAVVLGFATIAGVLLPTAAAQAAPAHKPHAVVKKGKGDAFEAGLTIASQINKIAWDAHDRKKNRRGYVKSLVEGAWYGGGEQYNVAVIKYRNKYDAKFNGVVYDQKVSVKGYPAFRVVAFKEGSLNNKGDGGYQNWAFKGKFDRKDKSVKFRKW